MILYQPRVNELFIQSFLKLRGGSGLASMLDPISSLFFA
jgi:hypothetical protein